MGFEGFFGSIVVRRERGSGRGAACARACRTAGTIAAPRGPGPRCLRRRSRRSRPRAMRSPSPASAAKSTAMSAPSSRSIRSRSAPMARRASASWSMRSRRRRAAGAAAAAAATAGHPAERPADRRLRRDPRLAARGDRAGRYPARGGRAELRLPADQRVINIVLKENFRAFTIAGGIGVADRRRADRRIDANASFAPDQTAPAAWRRRPHISDSSALLESERDIIQSAPSQPFDLAGNVGAFPFDPGTRSIPP